MGGKGATHSGWGGGIGGGGTGFGFVVTGGAGSGFDDHCGFGVTGESVAGKNSRSNQPNIRRSSDGIGYLLDLIDPRTIFWHGDLRVE